MQRVLRVKIQMYYPNIKDVCLSVRWPILMKRCIRNQVFVD